MMKTPINTAVFSLLSLAFVGGMSLKAQNTETPAAAASCPSVKGGGHGHKWLSVLNEQEQAQLKAAMKQVRNDPALVAARQAAKDAMTPEEKASARQTLQRTRRDLLLGIDPSLAPVLEKIRAAKSCKKAPVS
jgi:Spy/CpxP family protein refolding chaperone